MEKDNKKLRDAAKKRRNEVVRVIIPFLNIVCMHTYVRTSTIPTYSPMYIYVEMYVYLICTCMYER